MLTLHFTEAERQQLHRERFYHPDPRVQRKIEVVYLKSHPLPHHQIARLSGVSPRTVLRYLWQYQGGGIEALKQSSHAGKVSELAQTRAVTSTPRIRSSRPKLSLKNRPASPIPP